MNIRGDGAVVKIGVFLVLFAVAASGCGGGGSKVGGDSPPERQVLERVEPAVMDSAEKVVVLAPTTLLDTLFVEQVMLNAYYRGNRWLDVTEHEEMDFSHDCMDGGKYVFVERRLEDVGSPFSGALFDVVESRLNKCGSDLSMLGASNSGLRLRGYPVSGIGSGDFFEETDFVAFEQFGASAETPYVAVQDSPSAIMSYYRQAFIHLKRDNKDDDYGDAGGHVRQFSKEKYLYINAGKEGPVYDALVQFGESQEKRFSLDFSPNMGIPRVERYSGRFGFEIFDRPSSCPQGALEIETLDDMHVIATDRSNSLHGRSVGIQSGLVEMRDDYGNQATVNYDDVGRAWTVTLNDQAPIIFSYEEIESIHEELCNS